MGPCSGLHPVGHIRQPVASAQDPGGPAEGDGRDRGLALLRARRRRPRGDRPRRLGQPHRGRQARCRADRRSRCSSRATSTSPNPQRTLERKIKEAQPRQRGGGRALQGLDPQPVPEHRLLRHHQRRYRGRRRGGGGDLLLEARSATSTLARVGAARRDPAGALALQPAAEPAGALDRRNEVLQAMGGRATSATSEYAEADGQDLGLDPGTQVQPRSASPTSSTSSSRSSREATASTPSRTAGSRSTRRSSRGSRRPPRARSTPARSATRTAGRRRRSPRSIRRTVRSSRWRRASPTRRTSQFNFAAHAQRQPGPPSRSST